MVNQLKTPLAILLMVENVGKFWHIPTKILCSFHRVSGKSSKTLTKQCFKKIC